MDIVSQVCLKALAEKRGGPCVSLYMPTHRAGQATKQDPIRLKTLLKAAEHQLMVQGLRSPDARAVLEPGQQLLAETLFWPHLSDGLALFMASGVFHCYRIPLRFVELLVVANSFHLKPLFPLLTGDGHFFVLALSRKSVRLLEGTRHSVDEVELKGVPASLAEALPLDGLEKQQQFHTRAPERGSRRAAMFHGHGPGDEHRKNQLSQYFRQIDRGVCEALRGERAPLVLAGAEYYFSIYRETNSYPHLLSAGIPGNAGALSPAELHRRAWPLVEPHFQQAELEALARYRQLAGTGQAFDDVHEVVQAACRGRVETLFVAVDAQHWGTLDLDHKPMETDVEPQEAATELLDLAAIQTFMQGGSVYALASERLPSNAPLAAIYRY